MTHQVAEKSKLKSKKVREAIDTKDKVFMWNTLQEYLKKYKEFISKTNKLCICNVDTEFYNQVTIADIEQQLKIMVGVIYDYEAKHYFHNEAIKQCTKKMLKASNMFTSKEIELLLL